MKGLAQFVKQSITKKPPNKALAGRKALLKDVGDSYRAMSPSDQVKVQAGTPNRGLSPAPAPKKKR